MSSDMRSVPDLQIKKYQQHLQINV